MIETQMKLRGVEFHFCPSNEKVRVEQPNPPLLGGLKRHHVQATRDNCKPISASGLHVMPPSCMFSNSTRHYSFGIIAGGLVMVDIELPLLGQFVPSVIGCRFPVGASSIRASSRFRDG